MLLEICVLIFIVVFFGTAYVQWRYSYWKRQNVPVLPPTFPFGNIENPSTRKRHMAEWIEILYHKYKDLGVKHAGVYLFLLPNYFPITPEAIKNVMQNDFQYFVNRGVYYNEKDDPLSAHLFAIGGQKWRNLRTKLTPTFTSGKMKSMFNTLVRCTKPMEETITSFCLNNEPIIIKDVVARFTTDVIGCCAFGLEFDSFKSDDAPFRYHGRRIFETAGVNPFKRLLGLARPTWARKLGILALPQDSAKFFLKVVKDTVKYRRENNVQRKDMLQLVMDLQKGSDQDNSPGLTIEEIAAQALVFFLAGFETSSTTMTFCLYELANNIDIQDKLREEVTSVLKKYDGNITYEAIMDMKYMNQVIDETLRKYPALPILTRECVKDYPIPSTNIKIKKGVKVIIPVLALHRDPEYFENPQMFNPERFSEENKANIRPFTYIPFGEGPRLCIGMRFGMMQTKVGLACLLRNYSFTLDLKTKPLVLDKYSIVLSTESPIWLNPKKLA